MSQESPPDLLDIPASGTAAKMRETEFQEAVRWRAPAIHGNGGFLDPVADVRRRSEPEDPAQPALRQAGGASEPDDGFQIGGGDHMGPLFQGGPDLPAQPEGQVGGV